MKPKGLSARKPLKAKTALKASSVLRNKKKPVKQKKPTVTILKKKAIASFNRAIKYRDSELIDGAWVFTCITCPRKVLFRDAEGRFYKNAHAGHFMPCHKENTRFDEENVNGQCGSCNHNQGEQYKYGLALELKYGDGTADKLQALSKVSKQWTPEALQAIIDDSLEQIRFYESRTT